MNENERLTKDSQETPPTLPIQLGVPFRCAMLKVPEITKIKIAETPFLWVPCFKFLCFFWICRQTRVNPYLAFFFAVTDKFWIEMFVGSSLSGQLKWLENNNISVPPPTWKSPRAHRTPSCESCKRLRGIANLTKIVQTRYWNKSVPSAVYPRRAF